MSVAEKEIVIAGSENGAAGAYAEQRRIVYRRGDRRCAHIWHATGVVAGGHARFRCGKCGALMSEPVCQEPLRFTQCVVPAGHALCAVCGRAFEADALERAPYGRGRLVCGGCLDRLLAYNNHEEPFFFRLI